MRVALLLVLVLLFAACGGAPDACEPRRGLYRLSMTPTGGSTCPALPDTVFNADTPANTSNCAGGTSTNDSMCQVALDLTCPTMAGGTVLTRGLVTWAEGGESGNGTLYMELRDESARLLCAGTYNARYQRL